MIASKAQVDVVLRNMLLRDFKFFTSYFFNHVYDRKFIFSDHHLKIIEALERCSTGKCTRLIINMPPRYGKTELVVKMFLAWVLAKNPKARSIHISYSDDLVLDNSSAIRDIIKSEDYSRLFNTEIRSDTDSRKKWYTTQGGGLYAVSSGGAITGFGAGAMDESEVCAGAIVIDDANKPEDAFSDSLRGAVNRRYMNTIASRPNSKHTPIIVLGQRVNEDDLSGFLLGGGSGEDWETLIIPAINDDGTALWSVKHDIETLHKMRINDPYTFAGQYMQSPSPIGGGQFKTEHWKRYSTVPKLKYRVIYGDTALRMKELNDYSVFQLWGRGRDGVFLLDQVRGKWESPELLSVAKDFWKKHCGGDSILRCMKIEAKASGIGLVQQLERELIPVVGIERSTDKSIRASDVVHWVTSGKVFIPANAPWIKEYIAEFEAFPNGKHDDQVDPTVDALNDMLNGVDMAFFDSDTVIESIKAGSGRYTGSDQLVCGVYVARDSTETTYIVFRRGKDACSEKVYKINWEKSKDLTVISGLIATVISKHKPEIIFISETATSGVITDRLVEFGFNTMMVSMFAKSEEHLKYANKLAECYAKLRKWILEYGSITDSSQLERATCEVSFKHDTSGRLEICNGDSWINALATTFAYPIPERVYGGDDRVAPMRSTVSDYDPLNDY